MPRLSGLDWLEALVADRVRLHPPQGCDLLPGSSPVVALGRLREAEIATIGVNPSHLEFVDGNGNELRGANRRLHTLNSLGINSFAEAGDYDVLRIMNLCQRYFESNPNADAFKSLDGLLARMGASYYAANRPKRIACHLNLVQSSTMSRWADLSPGQRSRLLRLDLPFLLQLIKLIPVRLLILNGSTVVSNFAEHTGLPLLGIQKDDWTMISTSGKTVNGIAYLWKTSRLGHINLGRTVLILGYNHNFQNTWGIAAPIRDSIAQWVAHESEDWLR